MSVVPRLWVIVNSVAEYGVTGVIVVAYLVTTFVLSTRSPEPSSARPENVGSSFTEIALAVISIPLPAVYSPAAENCVQVDAPATNAVTSHP